MSDLQVDPVVGYRMFELEGHELVGHHGERWVPGKNQAHCDQVRKGARRRKVWVNDPDDPDSLIQTTLAHVTVTAASPTRPADAASEPTGASRAVATA